MGTKTFDRLATLGLYTETPLHCGAESASGYVDLPIQRERHTGFPVIPGSTLKGVFRDEMRARLSQADVNRWFGEQEAAGLVSFGDGVIVAFPVRSTGQPFHWVTSPLVLERVFRALEFTPSGEILDAPPKQTAWASEEGDVLVEELRFTKKKRGLFADDDAVAKVLSLLPPGKEFEYTKGIFKARLLVVNDDDFRFLTETATEIVTRIKLTILGTTTGIKAEKKEVAEKLAIAAETITDDDLQGNMFVQEIVPSETLFLCSVRSHGTFPIGELPELVRIGGDETIGRGLTRVTRAKGA